MLSSWSSLLWLESLSVGMSKTARNNLLSCRKRVMSERTGLSDVTVCVLQCCPTPASGRPREPRIAQGNHGRCHSRAQALSPSFPAVAPHRAPGVALVEKAHDHAHCVEGIVIVCRLQEFTGDPRRLPAAAAR